MECEQQAATVSWKQRGLAMGHVAYLDDMNGGLIHCVSNTSTATQCVVQGVMCSTVYTVWVMALGRQYNSSDSNVTTLTSGTVSLCGPINVVVRSFQWSHSVT